MQCGEAPGGWVTADDYEAGLDDGKVVCRNAAGRQLTSLPAELADDPAVMGLRQLAEWLERHGPVCAAELLGALHAAAADRSRDVSGRLVAVNGNRFRACLAGGGPLHGGGRPGAVCRGVRRGHGAAAYSREGRSTEGRSAEEQLLGGRTPCPRFEGEAAESSILRA